MVSANFASEYLRGTRSFPESNIDIHQYDDRDYGVAFELVLLAVERFTGVTDPRDLYIQRHRLTFGFCWLGLVAFYALLRRIHGHWRIALAGCVLFAVTPRLLAHSFYNSKDMAAVVFTIFALYTMVRFVERPSLKWAVAHGISTAAAIATRMALVYLPVITLIGLAITSFSLMTKPNRSGQEQLWRIGGFATLSALLYLFVTAIVVIPIWPYLWERPLHRFIEIFRLMSQYWWVSEVLFRGEYESTVELPKIYLPVWMAITIPIPHLLLFFAGIVHLWTRLARQRTGLWTLPLERAQFLFLLALIVPIFAVVVLGSVLYDGWRHLYFIYPPFLCLAVYGLAGLWRGEGLFGRIPPRFRTAALVAVVAAGLLGPFSFIVRNHPHQFVYFNALARRPVFGQYEMDYWGLANRDGLEHILATDPDESIPVAVSSPPGEHNLLILPARDRARIRIVPKEEARYFLAHYRWRDTYENLIAGTFPYCDEVFSVRVEGSRLCSVFDVTAANESGEASCPRM